MHSFVLGIFSFIKNTLHFLRIVCVFCIMMLALYWVQNLINADWTWIGFIKPFLDSLLAAANSIYSFSFKFFGAEFELKYFSAVVILVIASLLFRVAEFAVGVLEGTYKSARFVYKKTEEVLLNKKLALDTANEEKKLQNYTVVINTRIKNKFAHIEQNINLDEQNALMNDYITAKTSLKPALYDGGFMYSFNNFDKADRVLDILFKLLHSEAPIDYAICIQINNDMKQLKKLVELRHFGKVTMAADTSYRYRFNETHKYQTSHVGIFQYEGGTIEVHEFKEIL